MIAMLLTTASKEPSLPSARSSAASVASASRYSTSLTVRSRPFEHPRAEVGREHGRAEIGHAPRELPVAAGDVEHSLTRPELEEPLDDAEMVMPGVACL